MTEDNPKTEKQIRLIPPITKSMLAKNDSFQKQLREIYGNSPTNPQQQLLTRNRLLIEENKVYLRSLLNQLAKTVSISEQYKKIQELILLKSEETADALAEVGEFLQAAKFTLNSRKKHLFRSYQKAMELDDSVHCEHPKYKMASDLKVNNYFREKDIFSPKHGQIVSIIRCNECEFRNIRPLPEDLARASQIRAEFKLNSQSAKPK